MTMRKPNYTEEIVQLKNEIETVEKFMVPLVRESDGLDKIRKERTLTSDELKRATELFKLLHDKNVWLVKAKEQIKKYYTPVSA